MKSRVLGLVVVVGFCLSAIPAAASANCENLVSQINSFEKIIKRLNELSGPNGQHGARTLRGVSYAMEATAFEFQTNCKDHPYYSANKDKIDRLALEAQKPKAAISDFSIIVPELHDFSPTEVKLINRAEKNLEKHFWSAFNNVFDQIGQQSKSGYSSEEEDVVRAPTAEKHSDND